MNNDAASQNVLFEVSTPLGCSVRTTEGYWLLITRVKHPVMTGREAAVQQVLLDPDEVRRSTSDDKVYLFYKLEHEGRWLCAVARKLNGEGFLITAYPTDAIKEGRHVWPI